MSISTLFLALLLFLMAAQWLAWFPVSATFLGVVALVTAILLVVEGGPVLYNRYIVRK